MGWFTLAKKQHDHIWNVLNAALSIKKPNTSRRFLSIWKQWCAYHGMDYRQASGPRITAPTRSSVLQYIVHLRKQPSTVNPRLPISDSTVRATVGILSLLYEELRLNDLVTDNPFHRLHKELPNAKTGDRRPHKNIPLEKVKLLLSLPDNSPTGIRDRALLSILLGGGLRRSEVVSIRLEDIQVTEAGATYIRLYETKGSTSENAALPNWVADAIEALRLQRLQEGASIYSPLFCTYKRYSRDGSLQAMSAHSLYRIFLTYVEKAGLPKTFTPHSARATAITRLLDLGVSHRDLVEFSRHKSISMVERYDKRRLSIDQSPAKKLNFD